MAQKNILNQVKTATGYDTLYPLTPYQIHQAKSVTGDGSNYAITIDLPAENITMPIIVSFTPNVANLANCTISVNGLESKPLYINNASSLANALSTTDICLVQYNVSGEMASVISASGKLFTTAEVESVVPKGLICMWSGSTVPTGWYLCNGQNGTPDLRNRFIVGSGSGYSIGATGGSNTVTLTVAQMPSHKHSGTTDNATVSKKWQTRPTLNMNGNYFPERGSSGTGSNWTVNMGNHTHTFNTGNTGSGSAHENRPPYYALAFIMKG